MKPDDSYGAKPTAERRFRVPANLRTSSALDQALERRGLDI
ncbi:MAG: hypothetical protein ABIT91_10760 [Gemmatimonadaceae bacterium]